MEVRTEEKEIQDWFYDFITLFRKNCAELSEFEKTGISNDLNFHEPCQIEVFWLKYPELQLIVQSNLPERKDMEITVHGPFEGTEFCEKIEPILSEERWQKTPRDDEGSDNENFEISEVFGDPGETLAELLAKELNGMREYAKFLLFYPYDHGDSAGGSQIDKSICTHMHVGNVSEANYKTKVEHAMTQIKSGAKVQAEMLSKAPSMIIEQFKLKEPFRHSAIQVQKEGGYGFGVHVFPPVLIGKMIRPTIRQLLEGVRTDITIFNKSFDLEIDGKVVIVNRDGYIFVESATKEEALKILNVMMALGTFGGIPMYAVREQDLSTAGYDKNRNVSTKQWNLQTIRSQLHERRTMFDVSLSHGRTELTKDDLTSLIKDAFALLKNNELANDLKLFVEAFTYYRSTEYSQSFVMSWGVIERHYSSMWENMLNEQKLGKKRFYKLTERWSIDSVIESLNLNGKINEDDYKLLMELKKERNDFYHGTRQIPKEIAGKCLNLVRKIINDKQDSKF